jgi:2TM domain
MTATHTAIDTTAVQTAGAHPDTQAALLAQARRRVGMKIGLLAHALAFSAVNLGLLMAHVLTDGARGLSAPLWGWGLGLTVHAIVVTARLRGNGFFERQVAAEAKRLKSRG